MANSENMGKMPSSSESFRNGPSELGARGSPNNVTKDNQPVVDTSSTANSSPGEARCLPGSDCLADGVRASFVAEKDGDGKVNSGGVPTRPGKNDTKGDTIIGKMQNPDETNIAKVKKKVTSSESSVRESGDRKGDSPKNNIENALSPNGKTNPKNTNDAGSSKSSADVELADTRRMNESIEHLFDNEVYKFGVTKPISLNFPSPPDLSATGDLVSTLRVLNLFESEQGCRKREHVLKELNKLLSEWTYELGLEMGMDMNEAKTCCGKMFTFGSYRLGCITPGSDIDALSVVPRHVRRESFFTLFYSKLQSNIHVHKLQAVPNAYTPIIKLVYDSIDVDLLFARVSLPSLPTNLETLSDDSLLKNVDDKSVRSLNGCRVADGLLELVPFRDSFRMVLRFIKYWATQRGIYSNVLGYLGGVSWAILVARICQLYPNYSASQLISRFFRVYEKWYWKNPVVLCKIKESQQNVPGLMGFKIWNPKIQPVDRQHIMPIITPAFPSMNTTHNVTKTTRTIILSELERGHSLTKAIESKHNIQHKISENHSTQTKTSTTWADILAPFNFFKQIKHFLMLQMLAVNDAAHCKWQGWVESKLRFLIRKLENLPHLALRPWPTVYRYKDTGWESASAMFVGLTFSSAPNGTSENTIDLRSYIADFVELIYNWPERSMYENKIQFRVKHVRRGELPSFVFEQMGGKKRAEPEGGRGEQSDSKKT